jgi:hypothetical protein
MPIVECVLLIAIILSAIGYVLSMTNLDFIKENWQKFKCNPQYFLYYPILSNNVEDDLSSCIQNVMAGSIGGYLSPLNMLFSSLSSLGVDISNQIKSFGAMLDYLRTTISTIVSTFFGYIMKILLIFYKFQFVLRQILSRFVGIMMASLYMLRGSLYFGNSIWNGVPGQMIKVLSNTKIGSCFHQDTQLMLSNGTIKKISEVQLGDTLAGNTIVVATMQIQNTLNECMYSVPGGLNETPIYVTGTHYIYNSAENQFQIVETMNNVHKTNIQPSVMYCLITNTNMIPIGNNIFWDWEDYKINALAV